MQIIFSGSIGRSVTGGQAWANLQYLIGLRNLGHEVYYLEDCGEWSDVYNWERDETSWDLEYPGGYIHDCLEPFGYADRWIYRAGDQSVGMTITDFCDLCRDTDLLIIRGIPFLAWRAEYDLPRRRAFIDVDPGFTQLCHQRGEIPFIDTIARCNVLFTIGHHIGEPGYPIPDCSREWLTTVSPVSIAEWPMIEDTSPAPFTSVMRWKGMKDLQHDGVEYGQRDKEFLKFIELPRRTPQHLKIAITGGGVILLNNHGWDTVSGWSVSKTPAAYQEFIQQSRAEFGVAKNTYVDTRSAWFSDRSACYLASGRPVLVQDTGIGCWLPVGEGVVTFQNLDEAVSGIEEINNNYEKHRCAARKLALEYFSVTRVLASMLEAAVD